MTIEPKPPISPARLAANQANALRSSGPKTEQGKARSRLNGLVHGLRAELPILPGEDPEALRHRLDAWTRDLAPQGDLERHLVETAVQASWRMDRCRAVETAALTQQIADVEEAHDDRLAGAIDPLVARFDDEPGAVRDLRQSSRGCRWLIARWESLAEGLERWPTLELSGKYLAFQLMGKEPRQLFDDPIVRAWTVMHLAAAMGDKDIDVENVRALLWPDRPEGMHPVEFERRVDVLIGGFPDATTAHAFQVDCIADAIAELAERAELLEIREARDKALAVQRAAFDESKEGGARLRYEMGHHRVFRAALRDLNAAQKARLARGEPADGEAPSGSIAAGAPTEPNAEALRPPADASPPPEAPTEPKAAPPATVAAPGEPKETGPIAVGGVAGGRRADASGPSVAARIGQAA